MQCAALRQELPFAVAGDGDGRISFRDFYLNVFGYPHGSGLDGDARVLLDETSSGSDFEEAEQVQQVKSDSFVFQLGQMKEIEPQPEPGQLPLSRSAQRYVNQLWRSLDRIDQEPPPGAVNAEPVRSRDNSTTVGSRSSIQTNDEVAADCKLRAVAVVQREQQAKIKQQRQSDGLCGETECTPDTASSRRGSYKRSTDAVRSMMQLQEVAGQLLAAEAAASRAESAMMELRARTSDCEEEQLPTAGNPGEHAVQVMSGDSEPRGRDQSGSSTSVIREITCRGDLVDDSKCRGQSFRTSLKTSLEPECDQGSTSDGSDASNTDEEREAWSPHRASVRVASAASAAVAAAAVEEVARLRAELADRDRQIAEFLRTQTANETRH